RVLSGGASRRRLGRTGALRRRGHRRLVEVLLERESAVRDEQRDRRDCGGARVAERRRRGPRAPRRGREPGRGGARAPLRGGARAYRLTDVSPLFLKRAQRSLPTRFPGRPLEFAALDIDQPFAASGVAPGSFGLVYAVNVVHVSRDLGATLREIRTALADGG